MHAQLITQHFIYKHHCCYSAVIPWQGPDYEYRFLRKRTASVKH